MDKPDTKQTIDEKHQEMMNMFLVIEKETIPNLCQEQETCIVKRNEIKKKTKEKRLQHMGSSNELVNLFYPSSFVFMFLIRF